MKEVWIVSDFGTEIIMAVCATKASAERYVAQTPAATRLLLRIRVWQVTP